MDGPEWNKLRFFFEGQVAAAVTRRTGIALAIDNGVYSARAGTADDIDEVAQRLCREALKAPDSAWYSEELERLIPRDYEDATGFPYVPTVGEVDKGEQAFQEPWCWALKMGYARDRVIAYARVKAALLDVHNLSSGPELHTALFRVWGRANAGMRDLEQTLKAPRATLRTDPAVEIHAQRTQWERLSEDMQNAQRQQPTLLRAPLVTGLTAREVAARATDPFLEREATYAAGAETRKLMPERDALMGTETFVSFTFPSTDHGELYAVGASAAGVRVGDKEHKMPALVTLHNPTGALEPLATRLGNGHPFNVFMTNDAATLLTDLHSLIMRARKSAPKVGEPLPLEKQRNYLLLEHGAL